MDWDLYWYFFEEIWLSLGDGNSRARAHFNVEG